MFRKLLACAWLLMSWGGATVRGEDLPNIVYFMSDEIGYYELSCLGNPNIQTPNIDRMAAEGVRFTQMLAGSSVCAPTRCCLMTGKHSGHTSVRTNGGGTPLRADEVTIASLLKSKGYATGGFGKWGCGGRGSTGVPEKHGFDVFVGYYDQVHAHSYYPPYIVRNSEEIPLEGNHGLSNGRTYSHYVIFKAGLDFIRQNKDRPFYCYLPVTPPHGLFDIPDDDPAWALYKDKDWPEPAKRYAAMVTMVDRNMGEVLSLLNELGLAEKTLVVFSGDNGGNDYFADGKHPRGFHEANVDPQTRVEFRGKKGQLYEGGLRVPYIARWPGRIAPGRVSDHLGYFPDVLPTLCELAGVEPPADVDGISFLPELIGAEIAGHAQQQHQYLYWELNNQTAVRMNNWKAYRPRPNAPWELYNLSEDISEKRNVAQEHPAVLKRLIDYAAAAHTPVEEGTFFDRDIHERDRQAKFGFKTVQNQPRTPGSALPQEGLVPREGWQVVRVSSEARGNGKLAQCAVDGDPATWWHTQFSPVLAQPPHELVIDLGRSYEINGFRYLPRQDRSWNGAIRECAFSVSNDPDHFASETWQGSFAKSKQPQEVRFPPVQGRYVRLRVLSEVNGGPWGSIAELGVVGK